MKQTKRRFPECCPFILLAFCVMALLPSNANRAFAGTDPPSPPGAAEAAEYKLGGQWIGSADFIGAYNPQGIGLTGGVDYRNSYRFSEQYKTVSAYWQTGAGLGVNPAYVQPSVDFEWMPWLPIILRLQYDIYSFFGTNGGLLSFTSPQEPFGDSARRARKGTEESGFGRRVLFQPTLQLKAGGLILRNQSDIAWYRFPGKGPYFLELEYDTLLKNGDLLFANRTQALKEIGNSEKGVMLVGPFYEVVRAEAARLTRERIGLLFYTEQGPQLEFFHDTHFFAQVGYNLEDPNRAREVFFILGVGGNFGIK
jgi:hypothetical protein